MSETNQKNCLLPKSIEKPSMLIWVLFLPQLLLLAVNLTSWDLIRGEMNEQQLEQSALVFAGEVILLLVGVAVFFRAKKKACVSISHCLWLLGLCIGYLWTFMSVLGQLMPQTVTLWILTPGQVLYYQMALVMPALFYAALRVACFPLLESRSRDVTYSLLCLVLVPVSWYILVLAADSFFEGVYFPEVMMMVFFVGSTVILLMAFFRVFTMLYVYLQTSSGGKVSLLLFAGVIGPIAGLCLNRAIPFPYDFQAPTIYALAVINGLVLMLPSHGHRYAGILWFLRVSLFPFTFYFFVVFLPFLPLSLLAMIAVGSGFLMLAPTLLFLLHGQQIIREAAALAAGMGRLRVVLSALLALSLIPGGMTIGACLDKLAIAYAIHAAYVPDYLAKEDDVDVARVKRSLLKLRDMKGGLYVPILSEVYNRLVFNGMVLPDHKMETIYQMFLGEPMPEFESADIGGFGFFGEGTEGLWRGQRLQAPDRNVQLASTDEASMVVDGVATIDVELELVNRGGANAEYVTEIEVSPGVLVTGYWLDVEGVRVPGRIFEKKTAMWVYHMIRDIERRDPGLLVYESADRLKLSVYPFAKDQTRRTGISFRYSTALNPVIRVGGEEIPIGDFAVRSDKIVHRVETATGAWLMLPDRVAESLPTYRRTPYLHFIVDHSAAAVGKKRDFVAAATSFAERDGAPVLFKATLANYRFVNLCDQPVALDELLNHLNTYEEGADVQVGSLCHERAIKRALLRYQEAPPLDEADIPMVPIFVVLDAGEKGGLMIDDLSVFSSIVPDSPFYYMASSGSLDVVSFSDSKTTQSTRIAEPSPVHVFRKGDEIALAAVGGSGIVQFDRPNAGELEEIYNSARGAFQVLQADIEELHDNSYARGLSLWRRVRDVVRDPPSLDEALPSILHKSRDAGVLVPLTAYIVVENSAQWKMLTKKEKQALSASQALEFDEFTDTPAPSILFLLPVAYVLLQRRVRKRAV